MWRHYPPLVTPRRLALLAAAPLLVAACSAGTTAPTPDAAASAPVPGVTLPADPLAALVPAPDEVPAGMVPVLAGSGPRDLAVVAGYSGAGAAATAAAARLRAHGFLKAYVGQYANPSTGQVLSVVASTFATAAGAKADFADDERAGSGTRVTTAALGEASSATVQAAPGQASAQLLLLRFRRGTTTWSLAYQAAPRADAAVAVAVAQKVLARTATS
jgi:hypothetical protein